MINKNWTRWIHVSVHKHFHDAMIAEGVSFFIEGQHRDTRIVNPLVELRINGPVYTEVSQNLYVATIDVNLLLQYKMDDQNTHGMLNVQGKVIQHITGLPAFRYGNGVDDDSSLLTCLELLSFPEGIHVFQFGQIDKDLKIHQASIEASFKCDLSN